MAMAPDLPPIFVINLDRAPDRWEAIVESATRQRLELIRVPAVDGRKLSDAEKQVLNARRFMIRTGRMVLPGEIGCHLSHHRALQTFLDQGSEIGLILEDDVSFDEGFEERLRAILTSIDPSVDSVRLVTHRLRGFRARIETAAGDRLGRALLGPQGSSAAYLIRRPAAERMVHHLRQMTLPYDSELARAWELRQSQLVIEKPLVRIAREAKSAIGTRADYRANKLFWLMRAPTALFRARETVERLVYALR